MLLGLLFGFSNWKSAIQALVPGMETVGGAVAVMVDLLSSPLPSIILVFWGTFHLWIVSYYRLSSRESAIFQVFAWIMAAAFVVPLCAVGLFGYFLTTSQIPQITQYVARQTYERHIDEQKYHETYSDLRQTSSLIPEFPILSVRSREPVQYASELVKHLRDAGFESFSFLQLQARSSTPICQLYWTFHLQIFGAYLLSRKTTTRLARQQFLCRNSLSKMGIHASVRNTLPDDSVNQLTMMVGDAF